MAHEIRRSPNAKADLIEIWQYVARHDELAADRLLDRLQAVFDMLLEQPEAGRARPELHEGLRSFPVGNYVVYYTAGKTGIVVIRVLSGFRDIMTDMIP